MTNLSGNTKTPLNIITIKNTFSTDLNKAHTSYTIIKDLKSNYLAQSVHTGETILKAKSLPLILKGLKNIEDTFCEALTVYITSRTLKYSDHPLPLAA